MSRPIVYIDTSAIREGKLGELEAAMRHLAEFVDENVPQLISYGFYLDQDQSRMTVVAVHPDASSIEFHMDACGGEFAKFAELIELLSIDVYGRIGDAVLQRFHHKARMLGNGSVTVHELHAGFAR